MAIYKEVIDKKVEAVPGTSCEIPSAAFGLIETGMLVRLRPAQSGVVRLAALPYAVIWNNDKMKIFA